MVLLKGIFIKKVLINILIYYSDTCIKEFTSLEVPVVDFDI